MKNIVKNIPKVNLADLETKLIESFYPKNFSNFSLKD